MKCEYCGCETIEVPDFEGADCYGEFHHVCKHCGAIGQEVFGHGISWTKGKLEKINPKNSNDFVQCDFQEKCSSRFSFSCNSCGHNRGSLKMKNGYVPRF